MSFRSENLFVHLETHAACGLCYIFILAFKNGFQWNLSVVKRISFFVLSSSPSCFNLGSGPREFPTDLGR